MQKKVATAASHISAGSGRVEGFAKNEPLSNIRLLRSIRDENIIFWKCAGRVQFDHKFYT